MAKFTEIPFFLLDKYFTDRDNSNPIILYVYSDETGFVKGEYYPVYNNEEFKFILGTQIEIENGMQVYFKKDSEFHSWLINTADSYYKTNGGEDFYVENYCNINPTFLYFGTIYKRKDGTPVNDFWVDYFTINIIDYNSEFGVDYTPGGGEEGAEYQIYQTDLRHFVKSSLPAHQRTSRLTETIDMYFDRIHFEIYALMRNLNTLLDPLEINKNYLEYLAFLYEFTLSDQFSVSTKRNFIRNLVDILKRKGTYSSIFDFWTILSNYTENKLNIYERGHDPDIYGPVKEEQYVDYLYIHPYITRDDTLYLPGGVGKAYYKNFIPGIEDLEDGAYITIVDIPESTLNINHELDTTNLLTQCYDTDQERIIPSITIVDKNNVKLEFGSPFEGYVFIRKADITRSGRPLNSDGKSGPGPYVYTEHPCGWYVNTQSYMSSASIIPNIYLGDGKVYSSIISEDIQILNGEQFKSSSESTKGTITHLKNKFGLIINAYDTDHHVIWPKSQAVYKNTLELTGSDATSGYVVLSEVGDPDSFLKNPYEDDLLLSPHYIVEIDLTDEPLDDTKIIDSNWHSDLIAYWEEMRPVDRVAVYRLLIGPIGEYDGSGNDIYEDDDTSLYMKTKFVGSDPKASILTFSGGNITSPYFEVFSTHSASAYEYRGLADNTYYQDKKYYYIIFDVPETEPEYTVREIRLKNKSNETIFLTQCSDIEKLEGVRLRIVYRIQKNN